MSQLLQLLEQNGYFGEIIQFTITHLVHFLIDLSHFCQINLPKLSSDHVKRQIPHKQMRNNPSQFVGKNILPVVLAWRRACELRTWAFLLDHTYQCPYIQCNLQIYFSKQLIISVKLKPHVFNSQTTDVLMNCMVRTS